MAGPRRSQRQTLTGLHHLSYDAKYHPMDDAIRPTQARKRKRSHLPDETGDLTSDDDTDSIHTPVQASRRRARRPSSSTPIYKGHPQDEQLKAAEALPSRRKGAIVIHSDTEVEDNDYDEPGRATGNAILTPATTSSTNKKRNITRPKRRAQEKGASPRVQTRPEDQTHSQKMEQMAIAYTQAWESLATPALTQTELHARDYRQMWEDTVQEYRREPYKWDISEAEEADDEEENPTLAAVNDSNDMDETGNAFMTELEAEDDEDPSASSTSTESTVRLSGHESELGTSEGHRAEDVQNLPVSSIQEPEESISAEHNTTVRREEGTNTHSSSDDDDATHEETEKEDDREEPTPPCTPIRNPKVPVSEAPLSSRLQRVQASAGKVYIVDRIGDVATKPVDESRWCVKKVARTSSREDDGRPVSAQSDVGESFSEVFKTTVFDRQREQSEEL